MIKRSIFFIFLLSFSLTFSQNKKTITHDDYDLWKSVSDVTTSEDGNIIATTVVTSTGRGDGYLQIYNTKTGNKKAFHNGYKTRISKDGNYVFFLRKPDYEVIRMEKKKDVKKDKMSKDAFFIYDVKANKILDSVSRVKGFQIPKEETGWAVIEKYKDLKPEKDTTAKENKPADTIKAKKTKNPALEGDYGIVYMLQDKKTDTIFKLKSFELPEEGSHFFFTTTKGEKKSDLGIFKYSLQDKMRKVVDTGRFAYDKLAVAGDYVAFLSARDSTETDSLKYELFFFKDEKLEQLTDTLGRNLRKNWQLSSAQAPYFSKNNERLYFYSRPERNFSIDTTLLEDEIPQLDVWNYKDKMIQPEQKARLKELKDKAYVSYFSILDGRLVNLHDQTLDYLDFDNESEQRFILGYTTTPYDVSRSWFYPWLKDYYIIETDRRK